jgi:hypothetical protein
LTGASFGALAALQRKRSSVFGSLLVPPNIMRCRIRAFGKVSAARILDSSVRYEVAIDHRPGVGVRLLCA